MIVSQPTQDALFEAIKQSFVMNRYTDRQVSVLSVKFACSRAAELIHKHGFAHHYSELADKIGERCLEAYNVSVPYGETPAAYEDYASAIEIIDLIKANAVYYQTMLMGVCKIALDNDDYHVYAELMDILREVNKMVEQAILLADKIHAYGEDKIMAFDHDIDSFWILDKE